MKIISCCLMGGLLSLSPVALADETAQARLWCLSPKFQSGTDLNGEYALNLTMLNVGINGELAPDWEGSYTHFSYLELTDQWFGETWSGSMYLDVPDVGDANGNGWGDSFAISQPVSAPSSGIYSLEYWQDGKIQA